MDEQGNDDQEIRGILGEVIIYSNVAFSAAALFYLCAKLFLGARAAYRVSKRMKGVEGRRAWLQLLVIPF